MLNQIVQRFTADQTGATAIEYALLGMLVAVGLIATLIVFGGSLGDLFNSPAVDTLGTVANSM